MGFVWTYMVFFFTPRVILTHLIGGGLIASLFSQGVGLRTCIGTGLLQELVSFVLWFIIPNSWATILALYFCIHIYESISGPRVQVEENATFASDEDISKILRSTSPHLKFDVRKEGGRYLLSTDFKYIVFTPKKWGQSEEDKIKVIEIDDVAGVDEGCDYSIVRAVRTHGSEPKQCLQMTVGAGDTSITILCPTPDTRNQWLDALQQLYGRRMDDLRNAWLRQLFKESEVTADNGLVTLTEAVGMLNQANRHTDRAYIKDLFTTFARTTSHKNVDPSMSVEVYGKFFDIAARRTDVHQIYERLLDKKKGEMMLHPKKFMTFLKDEQKESYSLIAARELIRECETIMPSYNMTSIGFTNYMLADSHNIYHRENRRVYQDMTRPMSHYFIATSHNTYLMKDQLRGKSSCEAYINAFKRGCKCVELDCWDGPNNEPIIYHGHTLTSKILFKDVVSTIGEYAFCVSDYPVILSFENHCSVEQQKVMAEHLKNILGSKMYTKQPPEMETKLPSPDDLRGYIIVKAKKLKAGMEADPDDEFDDEEITEDDIKAIEKEKEDEGSDGEGSQATGELKKRPSLLKRLSGSVDLGTLMKEKKKDKSRKASESEGVPSIAIELSDLVAYCQAVHFKGFEYSKMNAKHYEMSSFAEKKAFKFASMDSLSLVEYNKRQFARIYPAGARVDSSNYDPVPLWNCGVQLVALNYQTGSLPMHLNQGLFQDNGGCGFVLKPDILTLDNSTFDPRGPFDENRCKYVMIQVISGSQLPYQNENKVNKERNILVEVRFTGVEPDTQKEKTKAVKNNGFNPTWNELLSFKVFVPELALVTFTVKEAPNTFLAQYTLPMKSMMQGYRRVPLQNKMSEALPCASLFIHSAFKDQ